MSESSKKVRLEVWVGGYIELFNAEFLQNIILVKVTLVQVQNNKILSFSGLRFLRCFPA